MLEARNITLISNHNILFQNVNLEISSGKILGLSGPSGVGKTSLGRVIAGRQRPHTGSVLLDGMPLPQSGIAPVQYLAQNPLPAMNPRWRIGRILREAPNADLSHWSALGGQEEWLERYPHELSGGQLQRVSLARALAARPRALVADEITASLDPIAQAQIWGLLCKLCRDRGLAILAISHDAALLKQICNQGVMQLTPPCTPL